LGFFTKGALKIIGTESIIDNEQRAIDVLYLSILMLTIYIINGLAVFLTPQNNSIDLNILQMTAIFGYSHGI
jgi:hypothetical protein